MRLIISCLLFFAANACFGQSMFMQRFKMANNDSSTINVSEVRICYELANGNAQLMYAYPYQPLDTKTDFDAAVSNSCGNLVAVNAKINGQTKRVAINPQWINKIYRTLQGKIALVMRESGTVIEVIGTYESVSAFFDDCMGGPGALTGVAHDGTLTGDGTTGSPLKVDTTDIATQYDLSLIHTIYDDSDTINADDRWVRLKKNLEFLGDNDAGHYHVDMGSGFAGTLYRQTTDTIQMKYYDLGGTNNVVVDQSGVKVDIGSSDRLQINLGSDALGDIYYRNVLGNFVRIPIGAQNKVLQVRSSVPTWMYVDTSFTNEIQTIDTLSSSGTTISASLSQDGVPAKTLNLGPMLYLYGADSTWRKLDGTYAGKTPTVAVTRDAPISIRTNDTLGIITTRENPAQYLKPHLYMQGRSNISGDSADVFIWAMPSNTTHPPFIFGATNTPVISSAGTDVAWSMGFNYLPGGSRYSSAWSAGAVGWEDRFVNSLPILGLVQSAEFHFPIWTPFSLNGTLNVSNSQSRLISIAADDSARVGQMSLITDEIVVGRLGGSLGFNSYRTAKVPVWLHMNFYEKEITYGDSITEVYGHPQVLIPFSRFRSADDTRYWRMFEPDADDRLYINSEGNDMRTAAPHFFFNTLGTITTLNGDDIQIGYGSYKAGLSVYSDGNDVIKMRTTASGSNIWDFSVGSNNFFLHDYSGNNLIEAYSNSSCNLIIANNKWGFGKSPQTRWDLKQLSNASNSGMTLYNTVDSSYSWSLNVTGDLLWYNRGGSQRMILQQNGYLGLTNTGTPARRLDNFGETRLRDLITDNPIYLVGADADGDLNRVVLSGLAFSNDTLSVTGGGGGADGNGIYGDGTSGSGDDNLPTGGTDVGMNSLGKTIRWISDIGANTTREMMRFHVADDAFTRFMVFKTLEDSCRFFHDPTGSGRQFTLQAYGGAALSLASDSTLVYTADSIKTNEGAIETKSKVAFFQALTAGGIHKRFEGSANGQIPVWNETSGYWESKQPTSGTLYTVTSTTTVAATTTLTSIMGSGVGSLTLPANYITAGKQFRVRVSGIYSTPLVAAGDITIYIKAGSTTIAVGTINALLVNGSDLDYDLSVTFTCRTTGGSGTVMVTGQAEYSQGNNAMPNRLALNNGTGTITLDTTVSQVIDVQVQWSNNTAGNSWSSLNASLEALN